MKKSSISKTLLIGAVVIIDFVITLFTFLFILAQLNDPIDGGHFPTISYVLIFLQGFIFLIQFFLFYKFRKSTKSLILIGVLGIFITIILFVISEFIALSVSFN